MPMHADRSFPALLAEMRRIARDVAAVHAPAVDRDARFPAECVAALRDAKLLSAPVPAQLGGFGCTMTELGHLAAALAQGCASSAMVLVMHWIQLACVVRHAPAGGYWGDWQRAQVAQQWLLSSITSEVDTFGDTRRSICALQRDGDGEAARLRLVKEATTASYCAQSDALLVTCRRHAEAAGSDQLLVLVRREDATLTQTTSWDTLGMRGTCSPGFRIDATGLAVQVLPAAYADISAQSMVPYSHILWSALWTGIAIDAHARAAAFVRGQARKNPGSTPPTARALAALTVELQSMRHHWQSVAAEFDALPAAADAAAAELGRIGWALKLNSLKTACSEKAPQVVHGALQIVGILGYKNDSPFSLGRHYRDALSGALMVSNDRIAAKSADMLLVFKDD